MRSQKMPRRRRPDSPELRLFFTILPVSLCCKLTTMIGKTVSHYRIVDQLGEGGMGVVYVAEDTNLARRVAIKFLSSTTKEYRSRFLREARARIWRDILLWCWRGISSPRAAPDW